MMYLEAVDLDKLKSQAVCFSGEPSLNHDKKINNCSTPASFVRGPGFDAMAKRMVKTKHPTYLLLHLLQVHGIFTIFSSIQIFI